MKKRKGFTLIELLLVVSIISILVGVASVSYLGAQKQSRDTQRKSDLSQCRNALENFAAANGSLYPGRSKATISSAMCSDLTGFLSSCPQDPSTYDYYYEASSSCSGSACAESYVVSAQLETGDYWEVCSDGRAGKTVCDSSEATTATCSVGTTDEGGCSYSGGDDIDIN